jgi:uncharacterized membrane protein
MDQQVRVGLGWPVRAEGSASLRRLGHRGFRGAVEMAVAAVVCLASAAHAQSFTIIDPAPGYNRTRITGLADDGKVIGDSNIDNQSFTWQSFTWTPAGGRQDFTPTVTSRLAGLISGDGNVIAGSYLNSSFTRALATVRNSSGSWVTIPSLPGYSNGDNGPVALSRDGSRIVGYSSAGQGGGLSAQSWIWSATTGTQAIPTFTGGSQYFVSSDTSGDGLTAVGYGSRGALGNNQEAWIWRDGQGTSVLPSPLNDSEARAVTPNGDMVVGRVLRSIDSQGFTVYGAAVWRDRVLDSLGTFGDFRGTTASSVSNNGSLLVGNLEASPTQSYSRSFVWTQATGMVLMEDYLQSFGIVLPANKIIVGNAMVSGDGRTFAGTLLDLQNPLSTFNMDFVATIPAPAGMPVLFLGLLASARRRR